MGTRLARRPGPLVCLVSLACFAVFVGTADAQTMPFQAAFAGQSYALVEDGGTPVVLASPAQQRFELPVEDGAIYSHLAATQGGWLAVGSQLDEDGHRALILAAPNKDEDGVRLIQGLPEQESLLRQGAVILVDDGRLAGLAWLEGRGRRELAVTASEWTGKRWRTPRTVSAAGPGSQIALSGTVLADGSWLLAWSAFDGQDDEIVWSQRLGDRWSRPRTLSTESAASLPGASGDSSPDPASLNNGVPDITPSVTACGTGALVAWSRYSAGHYRLQMARFDGHGWVDKRTVGGPGTIFPVFLPSPEAEARLLFRNAGNQGWSALEFDRAGLPLRQVDVAGAASQRPLVTTETTGRVRFSWSQDSAAQEIQWQPVLQQPVQQEPQP